MRRRWVCWKGTERHTFPTPELMARFITSRGGLWTTTALQAVSDGAPSSPEREHGSPEPGGDSGSAGTAACASSLPPPGDAA